jgi:hypothetical protein
MSDTNAHHPIGPGRTDRRAHTTPHAALACPLAAPALAALAAWLAPAAHAQPIEIQNPGFEDVVLQDDEFFYGNLGGTPGWVGTLDFTWGSWNPPSLAYPDETPEGSNDGWLYYDSDQGQADMTQALDATLQPGTTYTLSMYIGNPEAYFSEFNQFFYELEGFPGYRVELRAGDVVIAADENSLAPPDGTFEHTSIAYEVADDDPLIGEQLSIRLVNLNEGPGFEVDFDDVQLVAGGACIADCDGNGSLNILDFVCFQNLFQSGDPGADCDANGQFNILDFVCFQNLFQAGCP